MRGKSSSLKSKNVGLESEKLKEPNLSGAHIRNLVKQLSSSRPRDPSNGKEHECFEGEGIQINRTLCRNTGDGFSDEKPEKKPNQPTQQHKKKQVRRRLHTSRPYQERLVNMAEARREIVTALKLHRAAMKQASDKQQQQQRRLESRPEIHLPEPLASHYFPLENMEESIRRKPRIYASNSLLSNNYTACHPGNFPYPHVCCSPYSWPVPQITTPSPLVQENLKFTLPSRTLGLNLNLQDFNCLDSTNFLYSSSSASTSSSPLSATTEEIPFVGSTTSVAADVTESGDPGSHHAMDDKEMAEIRSIGERYQVEWNDTLNLVNSAWWSKFLEAMEISPEEQEGHEDVLNYPFDGAVEFPAWLNADDSCLQQVDDFCSNNYFQDPALPCMDIEEIDEMDGDWLA